MSIDAIGIDLTSIDTTKKFALGTVVQYEGGKSYKYIQYENGTAAVAGVAGEVAYIASVAIGDATGNIVTSDISDCNTVPIGAGVLQASLTDGAFGWVQVTGAATLSIALTAGADGDPLTPTGAGDGTLDVVITTVALSDICAYAIDVSAKIIMCKFAH